MLLSKLVEGIDGKLIADGEFETMNYCTADVEKCFLTFMENPKFLEKINFQANSQGFHKSFILCLKWK